MERTFKQLKDIAQYYRGTEDTDELALRYQETEDAIILSHVFCKHFGLIITLTQKYREVLNEDDITSYALEELHKALMNFRPDSGAKAITLYSRFLSNRLKVEIKVSNYDKRKANILADSFEGDILKDEKGDKEDSGYSERMGYDDDNFDQIELLEALRNNKNLTENEYKYCEIIIQEVSDTTQIKDSDIASRLNISSSAVHYIKKSLQKKLGIKTEASFMLNF